MVRGILANKDVAGFLKPFAGLLTAVYSVPVPNHAHHSPEEISAIAKSQNIAAIASSDVNDALKRISRAADRAKPPLVLIAGSLYLAGEVLRDNEQAIGSAHV